VRCAAAQARQSRLQAPEEARNLQFAQAWIGFVRTGDDLAAWAQLAPQAMRREEFDSILALGRARCRQFTATQVLQASTQTLAPGVYSTAILLSTLNQTPVTSGCGTWAIAVRADNGARRVIQALAYRPQ